MHLMKVDPRALKANPDRARQTKSTSQADALLLATIKAVGIVQELSSRQLSETLNPITECFLMSSPTSPDSLAS